MTPRAAVGLYVSLEHTWFAGNRILVAAWR
jgi:hypothetical protein